MKNLGRRERNLRTIYSVRDLTCSAAFQRRAAGLSVDGAKPRFGARAAGGRLACLFGNAREVAAASKRSALTPRRLAGDSR
jgi:hypothetical protein